MDMDMDMDMDRDYGADFDLEEHLDPFAPRPWDLHLEQFMDQLMLRSPSHTHAHSDSDSDLDLTLETNSERVDVLPTVYVKIHAGARSATVRGIFNLKGPAFNVITEKFRRRFNLPFIEGKTCEEVELRRIGSGILGTTVLTISPHYDDNSTITMKALVLRTIDKVIHSTQEYGPLIRKLTPDMQMADPHFDEPGEVCFMAGTTHTYSLMKEGRKRVGESSLLILETQLGWMYMGYFYPEMLQLEAEAEDAEAEADERNRQEPRGNNQEPRGPNRE